MKRIRRKYAGYVETFFFTVLRLQIKMPAHTSRKENRYDSRKTFSPSSVQEHRALKSVSANLITFRRDISLYFNSRFQRP